MITYVRTNILTSQAQTVTNTVNIVGVMGKGLASEMKRRYPDMFKEYAKLCAQHKLKIGQLWLWQASTQWILNFPTKRHWRNPSKLTYIEAGLKKFVAEYERRGIYEIAFPRLGCGNGNLEWDDVRPLMETYLGKLPIPVYIHDFEIDIGVPEHIRSKRLANVQFERSFPKFMEDLGSAIYANRGTFGTIGNNTEYTAKIEDGNLKIARDRRNAVIPSEEIFELWTLLLRGPVTRRKLGGRSRDEAYFIFPILQALPYIRIIELRLRNSAMPSFAAELDDDPAAEDAVEIGEVRQGELAWH